MGSNKDDKKKQELLRQQQEADRLERQRLVGAAEKPPTLEPVLTAESQNWLDTTSGKNGPLDINNLTAMKPHLALYANAQRRQQGARERQGIGALRMGMTGDDSSGLAALLAQQSADRQQQEGAGQLENAYNLTDAKMRGQSFDLMGQQQARGMGLASLSNSNSANSTNMYSQFQPRPSMWQSLLLAGVQGAAGIGASFAGRPPIPRAPGG